MFEILKILEGNWYEDVSGGGVCEIKNIAIKEACDYHGWKQKYASKDYHMSVGGKGVLNLLIKDDKLVEELGEENYCYSVLTSHPNLELKDFNFVLNPTLINGKDGVQSVTTPLVCKKDYIVARPLSPPQQMNFENFCSERSGNKKIQTFLNSAETKKRFATINNTYIRKHYGGELHLTKMRGGGVSLGFKPTKTICFFRKL